jgi:hypothetical protein
VPDATSRQNEPLIENDSGLSCGKPFFRDLPILILNTVTRSLTTPLKGHLRIAKNEATPTVSPPQAAEARLLSQFRILFVQVPTLTSG